MNDFGGSEIWFVDPESLRVSRGLTLRLAWLGGGLLTLTKNCRYAYVYRPFGAVDWVDLQQLSWSESNAFIPGLLYLKVSPADPDLLAMVSADGIGLRKRGSGWLPQGATFPANIEFSEDGSSLLLVRPDTCDLDIYQVGPDGIVFDRTLTLGDCSNYHAAHGLLFFDSGLVFDPTAGTWLAQSRGLQPPSLVLPRPDRTFDTLSQVNGTWTLRRFALPNIDLIKSLPLPELAEPPLEMAEAGPDKVAFRTGGASPMKFHIADFNGNSLLARISITGDRQATLRFGSVAGITYRVERTAVLPATTWGTVQDNIQGTGSSMVLEVAQPESAASFYRVVMLP